MKIAVNIDPRAVPESRAVATIARGFLMGVVLQNCLLIRAGLVPRIYESGIEFRPEPWQGKFEEFADCLTVCRRGWGDCDDLVAWRVAELRVLGDPKLGLSPCKATIKVYWREWFEGRGFHAEVRLPDGSVEDPSRFLGMGPRSKEA